MRGITGFRRIAGALVGASLLSSSFALPQVGITVEPAPIKWVTVDAAGSAYTITPGVITTEGHRATVSAAPDELRATATYTLSPPGGSYTTYTGLPPVASATGGPGSPEGVFPACGEEANVGAVEPFCLPRTGSELQTGKTYYITWSPSYFHPPTLLLSLQVRYSAVITNYDASGNPIGVGEGFTSFSIPASQGFYAWSIPTNFLANPEGAENVNPARINVTFVLAWEDDSTPEADLFTRVGPTVFVTRERRHVISNGPDDDDDDEGAKSGGGGPNILAIVLPLSILAFLLVLFGLCFTRYRKTGTFPIVGAAAAKLRRRSTGSGYGVRQSRAERTGSVTAGAGIAVGGGKWPGTRGVTGDHKSETDVDGGIQLTDRESWSPTGRRNVFREELERQKAQEGK